MQSYGSRFALVWLQTVVMLLIFIEEISCSEPASKKKARLSGGGGTWKQTQTGEKIKMA